MTDYDARDPDWVDAQSFGIESGAMSLELAILLIIVGRLASIGEDTTTQEARRWEVADLALIAKILAKGARLLGKTSDRIYDLSADWADDWAAPYFDYRERPRQTVRGNDFLKAIFGDARKSSRNDIEGYCKTSVLQLLTHDGRYLNIRDAYRSDIDAAVLAFRRGEADYNALIGDVVRKYSREGVKVVYKSGHRRELYAAVQLNFRDTLRLSVQDLNLAQGQLFGADGVYVDAHGMCAPDHLPYQGKVYATAAYTGKRRVKTIEQVQAELTGAKERPIGQGYNCRHHVTPAIVGITHNEDADTLRRFRDESKRKTGFVNAEGRELTAYEFSQWQRAQETQVRKFKVQAQLYEKAGRKDDAARMRSIIQRKVDTYRKTSKAAKVDTREERMNLYDWPL